MDSLIGITGAHIAMMVAALSALIASAIAWRQRGVTWARLFLGVGCVVALAVLVAWGKKADQRPFAAPGMALASLGVAVGLWSAALDRLSWRVLALGGLFVGLAVGGSLMLPLSGSAGTRVASGAFGLAEAGYVLASGVLLAALTDPLNPTGQPEALHGRVLALALIFGALSLGLRAIGAQRAWGSYWSWDPFECWLLAAWLTKAIAAIGICRLGWRGPEALLALGLASAVALGVLFGGVPLVRWLALASLYVP